MQNISELEKAKQEAFEKYQNAQKNLAQLKPPELFALAAQEANDAWLEYKRLNTEFNNCLIYKKLGDLYGC